MSDIAHVSRRVTAKELSWLVVSLLIYFSLLLGGRALNVPDEGRYSEVAREMLMSGDFVTPTLDHVVFFHKPAFFYWLQSLSFAAFGITEWSVRLMPALFGVLGCILVYVAAIDLRGRRAGIISVAALATNPLYYFASHYANLDLEVAVLISGCLLTFLVGTRQPMGSRRRTLMYLAYGFAALATLTKGLIGVVLPGMVIGVWILMRGQWQMLREIYLPTGLAIFCAIALPWYIAVQIRNPEFFHFFFIEQQFVRYTGSGFNNAAPTWFYLPVLLIGFFPWMPLLLAGLFAKARRFTRRGDGVWLFLLLWIGIVTVFFSIPTSKLVGYILPVLPPMALLTGLLVDERLARPMASAAKRLASLDAVAVSGVLLAGLLFAGAGFIPAKYRFSGFEYDLRGIAALIVTGSIAIFWLTRASRGVPAIAATAFTGAALSLGLLVVAGHYNVRSTKPLAELIKPIQRPGDEIVHFEAYYQDTALYLQPARPIIVVTDWDNPRISLKDNWQSDLRFGVDCTPGSRQWMITEAEFVRLLSSDRAFFVFAPEQDASELEGYGLQPIADANGVALLTNRPDRFSERPKTG